MPLLVEPDVRSHESFLLAMEGFAAEGRGADDDNSMTGRELREWGLRWHDPEGFAAYVAWLRAQALEERERPIGFVPTTVLWWVDDEEWLGRINIRHRLTDWLEQVGGHIGYDVAPAHRRRGHATAMLRASLVLCAKKFGLDRVLVTCDTDNVASRTVIEACGGVYEDTREGKLRYWVPTS